MIRIAWRCFRVFKRLVTATSFHTQTCPTPHLPYSTSVSPLHSYRTH